MDDTNYIPPPEPDQPTDNGTSENGSNVLQKIAALLEERLWPDELIVPPDRYNFWPTENSPDAQAIRSGNYKPRGPDQTLTFERLSGSGIKFRYADGNVRGFRDNNFGNISDTAFSRNQAGYAGANGRFAQFATPEDGLRAMNALLDVYQNDHHLKTVQDIISRWAPPNENDTSWYYSYVAKRMGLNSAQDVVTGDKRAALISSIIQVECGHDPFGEERIKEVLAGKSLNMDKIVAVGPQTKMADLGTGEGKGHESGDALLRSTDTDYHLSAFGDNQALQQRFADRLGVHVNPANTAWCAYWLNSQLAANGLPVLFGRDGHPTGWAYDFINYGQGVQLADARPGDIAVFNHHVGFIKEIRGNQVIIRGGNQDNRVEDDGFSISSIKAIRRPPYTGEMQMVSNASPSPSAPVPQTATANTQVTAASPPAASPAAQIPQHVAANATLADLKNLMATAADKIEELENLLAPKGNEVKTAANDKNASQISGSGRPDHASLKGPGAGKTELASNTPSKGPSSVKPASNSVA